MKEKMPSYVILLVFWMFACWQCVKTSQNETNVSLDLINKALDNIKAKPTWHEHIHTQSENESSIITFNVTIDAVTKEESLFFIKKIFAKYGNPDSLTHEELEALLHRLGLGKTAEDQTHTDEHKDHTDQHKDHTDEHKDHTNQHKDHTDQHRHKKAVESIHIHTHHGECLTISQMLDAFHLNSLTKITGDQFTYLCPALVYQIDSDSCHSHDGDLHLSHVHQGVGNAEKKDVAEANLEKFDITSIPGKVWGFSLVAVIIISLVGLLGVAVIPIMQKVFYNHLLQFLVALAIGALTGDALLHLLPHAIMESSSHKHDHDSHMAEEHDHSAAAWKGLVALAGILFFFVTERLLTIITVIKRNRNSTKQEKKRRCEKFCDIETNKASVGAKLTNRHSSQDECDQTVMLVHPNKDDLNAGSTYALKSYADAAHEEFLHQCDEEMPNRTPRSTSNTKEDEAAVELMEVSKTSVEFKLPSSGHSHGHGHAHHVPNSVAAVAWMVILGDGIHNFSDGLAIGAAFANSITGGISTSIAVFCHELPHEIGDFAVLLRAGMTIKQAVFYNCLSSLLCLFGMLIGVAIGNISSASLWIFATVGGMFLYIALVDMLPEMSSVDPKKGENPFLHLLFQVMGILLGSGVMLLIAIFENDIKKAVS